MITPTVLPHGSLNLGLSTVTQDNSAWNEDGLMDLWTSWCWKWDNLPLTLIFLR